MAFKRKFHCLMYYLMMKSSILTFLGLFFATLNAEGQIHKPETGDPSNKMEEKYLELKDSLSQFQPLIPAVSSVIIDHNQVEINFFNSLISSNSFRNMEGMTENLPFRQTYFYNSLQVTYGISKDNLNLGFDLNTTSARIDYNRESSFLHIFLPNQGINRSSGLTITSIGCLLYTSDAADDLLCVVLAGR